MTKISSAREFWWSGAEATNSKYLGESISYVKLLASQEELEVFLWIIATSFPFFMFPFPKRKGYAKIRKITAPILQPEIFHSFSSCFLPFSWVTLWDPRKIMLSLHMKMIVLSQPLLLMNCHPKSAPIWVRWGAGGPTSDASPTGLLSKLCVTLASAGQEIASHFHLRLWVCHLHKQQDIPCWPSCLSPGLLLPRKGFCFLSWNPYSQMSLALEHWWKHFATHHWWRSDL